MTKIEQYQLLLINQLHENGIKRIVYTSSIKNSFFVKNACKIMECYQYEDARSVAYIGTGMMAESKEPVVICTNGDVEYRSFCSGLTEAYYRDLKIIAITISDRIKLDYRIEIKDTVKYHQRISGNITENQAEDYINEAICGEKPSHLDIDLLENQEFVKIENTVVESEVVSQESFNTSWLTKIIPENCTLFLGNNLNFTKNQFRCDCSVAVSGGYEGVLSRTLGASLCGKKEHYIGVVTEKEFIHDINSLGNRFINSKIVYIVYTKAKKNIVVDYAAALSFVCINIKEGDNLPKLPKAPTLITVDVG